MTSWVNYKHSPLLKLSIIRLWAKLKPFSYSCILCTTFYLKIFDLASRYDYSECFIKVFICPSGYLDFKNGSCGGLVRYISNEPIRVLSSEVALDSASSLSRIYSHPYRAGAYQVLSWILDNEPTLSCYELQVSDEARFQKWILVSLWYWNQWPLR